MGAGLEEQQKRVVQGGGGGQGGRAGQDGEWPTGAHGGWGERIQGGPEEPRKRLTAAAVGLRRVGLGWREGERESKE